MQTFLHRQYFRYALVLLLIFGSAFSMMANAATTENTVAIKDAWVRPTNPGQEVGAAYMTFLSAKDTTLISVESEAAESVEIHSMTMQNGIMKMRMLNALSLVAGKPYKLAPGGFHLMLFGLKKPLILGEQVNFVLNFKNRNKVEFKQNIKVMVRSSADESSVSEVKNH